MKLTDLLCAPIIFVSSLSIAQESKYDISGPLDMKQTGCNKVLCMKNGNTMLFHFEPNKAILVKVFDSSLKETGSENDLSHNLNEARMMDAQFKGLYDINNEGVLFIDQEQEARHQLVMLRYSSTTGHLIEDRITGESETQQRRMRYYVIPSREDDGYMILYCMNIRHPREETDMNVVYYNKLHQVVKTVPLNVAKQKFDYLEVLDAESQPQGLLVSIGIDSALYYGEATDHSTHSNGGTLSAHGSLYSHYVQYYFIPRGDTVPMEKMLNVSSNVYPEYTLYAYNAFANSINSLIYSYKAMFYDYGLRQEPGSFSAEIFVAMNSNDMQASFNFVQHTTANMLTGSNDSLHAPNDVPISFTTNENGLSTLISQTDVRYGEPETRARYNYTDYFGDISVNQYDDNGNKLWGTTLPLAQYLKSYHHYYDIDYLARRWQSQMLLADLPEAVYDRQFVSANTYTHSKNTYIIFNDYDKNFDKGLDKQADTVYSFAATNACYYKLTRKKELTRYYLLGKPTGKEYKCSFIEGAGYDEQRGLYATLVQYSKDGETSLRMAWCRLE